MQGLEKQLWGPVQMSGEEPEWGNPSYLNIKNLKHKLKH